MPVFDSATHSCIRLTLTCDVAKTDAAACAPGIVLSGRSLRASN